MNKNKTENVDNKVNETQEFENGAELSDDELVNAAGGKMSVNHLMSKNVIKQIDKEKIQGKRSYI